MRRIGLSCLAMLVAAACSDPLKDVPRLSDVEVQQDAGEALAVPAPEETSAEGGFLSRLMPRRNTGAPVEVAADATVAPVEADTVDGQSGAMPPVEDTTETPVNAAEAEVAEPESRGLLGILRRKAEDGKAAGAAPASATEEVTDAPVELAALAPEPTPEPEAAAEPRRGGLFGALSRGSGRSGSNARGPAPGAPDYEQVGPGQTLAYGQLARLCGAPNSVLGKKVATYPERRGQFTLYDTKPGSTAPHTFFVTGFDDGCARQFTAALAIFGSPVLHEQLRYGLPAKVQPYSTTDEAYEKLKSRVCRVAKGKPCGKAMAKMEKETTFLSVYERFGSNPRWKTILLHDGSVVATDIKD